MSVPKLSHVHLKVRRLQPAVDFYSAIFGFHATERVGDHFAFLTNDEAHHRLALQALGDAAEPPARVGVGLYHTAFEVDTPADLLAALERVSATGTQIHLVDHGISWAAYFSDPDGNGVEIFLDRRHADHGREDWKGGSARLTVERIAAAA